MEDSNKGTMRTSLELDRVKRDKSSMEAEVVKLKDQASAEKRKCEKMERDMVGLDEDLAELTARGVLARLPGMVHHMRNCAPAALAPVNLGHKPSGI